MQERAKYYADVLPDQSEEELLRLIFARRLLNSEVIAWLDSTDLDAANDGLIRLIPMLHKKMERLGVIHPEADRIRGIYRHTLYRNRLLMHRGILMVNILRGAGVPALLLKGAAMLAAPGFDLGTRPMSDLDILVPEDTDLVAVERIMRGSEFPESKFSSRSRYTRVFFDKNGLEYDLQSTIKHANGPPGASEIFWDDSMDVACQGQLVSVLSPEHFAFHAMIHGMRSNTVSPIRWVADVLQIVAYHSEFYWNKVASTAIYFRCQDPIIAGLEYLLAAGFVGAEVRPAIQSMEDGKDYAFDRRCFRNAALNAKGETRTRRLLRLTDEYSRQSAFENRRRTPLRLLGFLRDRTGGQSLFAGLRKLALNERK